MGNAIGEAREEDRRLFLGRGYAFYPASNHQVIWANSNSKLIGLQQNGEEVMYQKWMMDLVMTPPQPGGLLGSCPS